MVFCAALVLGPVPGAAEKTPQKTKAGETLYYRAVHQQLARALYEVADGFGFEIDLYAIPNVAINGIYRAVSPEAFFHDTARKYKLDWYVVKKHIFVRGRRARRKREFPFENLHSFEEFRIYLAREGPRDGTRFPLYYARNRKRMVVHAPRGYLDIVDRLHAQYSDHGYTIERLPDDGRSVMMFPLKHAWVQDKNYAFGAGTYSVPGIATLLRKLTGTENAPPAGARDTKTAGASNAIAALVPVGTTPAHEAPHTKPAAGKPAQKKRAPGPTIIADIRLNAILIYDHPARRGYYKSLIDKLDRRSKLVEIEAIVVDVAKNKINELGIDWRANKGRDSAGFGDPGNALSENGTFGLSAGLGSLTTALTSNVKGLLAKIRFLESEGNSRVVSRPSVLTMNNLEAVINTTERFFIRIEGYQDSSLYPVSVGTTMRVTPHIIPRGKKPPRIQLFVTIEDGTIDSSEETLVDGLPRIQENKVTTQAVIDHDGSLLIGGHVHTVSSQSVSRVPILGSIPILGAAFRKKQKTSREFIRLFIIRPRARD